MKKLKPIMLVGTASDVGKSVITTGLCRILLEDGYSPAPFKGQNMSNNSAATPDGKEIGRAQAVQADACKLPYNTDMNPVLLKPNSDKNCQVIVNGSVWGNSDAASFFKDQNRDLLFGEVCLALDRLGKKHNPIVMEGAGSISELNLKDKDITNLRLALHNEANCYLITDIDKGGIFGSLYGTMELLSPEERALIKGIIINKFRGDLALLKPGIAQIEQLCKVPVIGVVPYFRDIIIEEEDGLSLHGKNTSPSKNRQKIGIVLLSHMSNFTDFTPLENDERFTVFYSDKPQLLEEADILLLPGTKNTIADLQEIQAKGIRQVIQTFSENNKPIIGICGGLQMMGESISDPFQSEGESPTMPGFNLLPITTEMSPEKTTQQTQFHFLDFPEKCQGYEIHMGKTTLLDATLSTLNHLESGNEGYWLHENCWGTYMHGIFENKTVRDYLAKSSSESSINYPEFKDLQYTKLAALLRANLNIPLIYAQGQ
ncbi:MAG: adenosylcobyric acid synthase [Luteibaculaceae bacterium]